MRREAAFAGMIVDRLGAVPVLCRARTIMAYSTGAVMLDLSAGRAGRIRAAGCSFTIVLAAFEGATVASSAVLLMDPFGWQL
jgi:hypothetical protein